MSKLDLVIDKQRNKHNKLNVLFWGDTPLKWTGFGQVIRNITKELHKLNRYNIKVIAKMHDIEVDEFGNRLPSYESKMNSWVEEDVKPNQIKEDYPSEIELITPNYCTPEEQRQGLHKEMHGKYKLLRYLMTHKVDILFLLDDPYVFLPSSNPDIPPVDVIAGLKEIKNAWIQSNVKKTFTTIHYFPVDSEHVRPLWYEIADTFDIPVTYTKFGLDKAKEIYKPISERLTNIYHGVNTKDFYPMTPQECEQMRFEIFGSQGKDKFCILNLNRNQPRKDIIRTLSIYSKFLKRLTIEDQEKCVLFMYMQNMDIGCNIQHSLVDFPNLVFNKNVIVAGNYIKGNKISDINKFYNMVRYNGCGITTTLGEGWGLFLTEGYASRLPMICPNNTVHPELTNNGEYAYLIPTGQAVYQYGYMVNEPPRYPMIEDEAVSVLYKMYHGLLKDDMKIKTEKAYQFVQGLGWDKIVKEQWLPVFLKAEEHLIKQYEDLNKTIKEVKKL
jgi:glycosyltransferase involved in cell wall biosynthesis